MENKTSDKIEIPIELHTGFGPFIMQMSITEDIKEDFNIIVEQINDFDKQDQFKFIKEEDDAIHQRLIMPFDVLKGYVDFFQQTMSAYLSMARNNGAEVSNSWTVTFDDAYVAICKSGDFIHSRAGIQNQISCFAILSTTDEELLSECEIMLSLAGSGSKFYKSRLKISPKVGDMYVFPSSLNISMKPIKAGLVFTDSGLADENFEMRFFEGRLSISEKKTDEGWPLLHDGEAVLLEEEL